MSARSIRKKEVNPGSNEKVEVLYQRIGNRWYAFSEKDHDIFFGAVPEEALDGFDIPTPSENGSPENLES